MRPVEEYLLRMSLDNKNSKSRATDSLKIFEEMQHAFEKTPAASMSSIQNSLDSLVGKFSASSVAIRRIIENLTDSIMRSFKNLFYKIRTPLVEAGKRRALTIEQARFQFEGLGMDVEATMDSANKAVLGTAFGLDEAAMAAAMFGASGMRAGKEMTTSLRAISGVAAMTGSSYSDIANVFTSIAGNGRVMGNDLLRLSVRGVNAAAILGKSMGKSEADVRQMVTKGQIDFETFSKAMDDAFGEHSTKASETFKGSLSLVNSAIQRIGATMFAQGFVDKKNLFNAITPQINELHEALKPLINTFNDYKTLVTGRLITNIEKMNLKPLTQSTKEFVDMGGMDSITDGFEELLKIGTVTLDSIARAFKEVFDKPSLDQIKSFFDYIQNGFRRVQEVFTRNADNIKDVFKGIFSVFDLGIHIAKEFAKALFGVIPDSLGDNIFEITGNIGRMVSGFTESIKESKTLQVIIDLLSGSIRLLAKAFSGATKVFGGFLKLMVKPIELAAKGVEKLSSTIKTLFKGLNSGDIMSLFATGGLAAGTIGIKRFLDNFLDKMIEAITTFTDVFGPAKEVLESLTDSLEAMTTNVKARTLITIASAVGILALALKILDGMSLWSIAKGMTAITGSMILMTTALNIVSGMDLKGIKAIGTTSLMVGMAISIMILAKALKQISDVPTEKLLTSTLSLAAVVKIMTKAMDDISKSKKVEVGMLRMIGMAASVKILVKAMQPLADMEWGDLIKGLGGLSGLLFGFSIFAKQISGVELKPSAALSMVVMATSLKMMSGVVEIMGTIDISQMLTGLMGIALILGEISIFSKLVSPKGMFKVAASTVILAQGLKEMAESIITMGSIDISQMIQGLGGIAAILATISIFTKTVSTGGIMKSAVSMVVMGTAIDILVEPVIKLSKINGKALGKALISLASGLAVLSMALHAAKGTIPGAIAIVFASKSLDALVGPLKEIGGMSLGELAKGIFGIAGALTVIGVASVLLSPASMAMFGFAAALAAIGLAVGAVAFGLNGISSAIAIMANSTVEGMTAAGDVLGAFLDILVENVPKVVDLIGNLVVQLATRVSEDAPTLVNAGIDLIIGFLEGIAERLPTLIDIGITIIETLVFGLFENKDRLVDTGGLLIVGLISAMADGIRDYGPMITSQMLRLFGEVLLVVVNAGVEVMTALFGWIPGVDEAAKAIGDAATKKIEETFGAGEVGKEKGEEFAKELEAKKIKAEGSGKAVGESAKRAIEEIDFSGPGIDKGEDFVSGFAKNKGKGRTSGIEVANKTKSGAGSVSLYSTGENAGRSFSSGSNSGGVLSAAWTAGSNIAGNLMGSIKSRLGIASPSKVMLKYGEYSTEGFVLGVERGNKDAWDAGEKVAESTIRAIKDKSSMLRTLINDAMNFSPVITPVLDMSDVDTRGLEGLERTVGVLQDTGNRYNSVNLRSNQNGYNRGQLQSQVVKSQPVENHFHMNIQGELPRETIERMAMDFDSALKRLNDGSMLSRGEDVVF